MPAVDPVAPKKAKAKPAKVRVTVPDAGEATRTQRPTPPTVKVRMYAHPYREQPQKVMRQQVAEQKQEAAHTKRLAKTVAKIHVTPVASPDATDTLRSPAQRQHDAQVAADTVKAERLKVVREQGRGSGTRAVVGWVKSNIADEKAAKTSDIHGHGGSRLAVIAANLPIAGASAKVLKNAAQDAAELALTTPTSVVKLASDIRHHPGKVPGELVKPYVDFAHAPLKTAEEKPVSTALMLAPVPRVPLRVLGKAARFTGKQTLERPAATMPGTALREARTGSRDAAVRHGQSKHDAENPAPEVTVRDVHRRVDEAYGAQQKARERIVSEHMRDAHEHARTLPEHERETYIAEQRQAAHEAADHHAEVAYAKEFGVNTRPDVGAAERQAAKAERDVAEGRKSQAQDLAHAADAEHTTAFTAARLAVARAANSPTLKGLESRRRDAQSALAAAQRAAITARAAHGVAKGRAQVLADKVTDPRSAAAANSALATVEKRRAAFEDAGQAVKDARVRIRDLDQQIAAERQRISGVPPAEHQALTDAIHNRGAAQAELAAARAEAEAAKRAHINVKDQARNASLVEPEIEGRLFEHEKDARRVAERLNAQGISLAHGGFTAAEKATRAVVPSLSGAATHVPVQFVVRQAGEHFTVLPDFVAERLHAHDVVGSSQATGAKLMRVSRGLFTRTVLPLRATWLTGQAVEGAIRAGAMRAGPVSYLRARRLVAEMERRHPGSGEALLDRAAPGGRIGRVWKDFGGIGHEARSLADEFPGNPIAHALTDLGRVPGIKQVRQLYRTVTDAVFQQLNGRLLEGVPQRAMLGAALRDSPLLERSFLHISDQAMADAAEGLQNTAAQVELARAVQRGYGKYAAFSPGLREAILHWSPFLPWLLNSVRFLGRVLPADHPVITSLLAATSTAEEEWRKSAGLSLYGDHVAFWKMGSYPVHGGESLLHVGHYTPFGAANDPSGDLSGLILPQFASAYSAIKDGVDFTGKPLRHDDGRAFDDGEKWIYGLTQLGESMIPLVGQAAQVAGAEDKTVAFKKQLRLMSSSPNKAAMSSGGTTYGSSGYGNGAVGSAYDSGSAYGSSGYGN